MEKIWLFCRLAEGRSAFGCIFSSYRQKRTTCKCAKCTVGEIFKNARGRDFCFIPLLSLLSLSGYSVNRFYPISLLARVALCVSLFVNVSNLSVVHFSIRHKVPRVPEAGDQRKPIWAKRNGAGYSL